MREQEKATVSSSLVKRKFIDQLMILAKSIAALQMANCGIWQMSNCKALGNSWGNEIFLAGNTYFLLLGHSSQRAKIPAINSALQLIHWSLMVLHIICLRIF